MTGDSKNENADSTSPAPETIKSIEVLFDELAQARQNKLKWEAADPGGVPSEIKLRDEALAAATQQVAALEQRRNEVRGDYLVEDRVSPAPRMLPDLEWDLQENPKHKKKSTGSEAQRSIITRVHEMAKAIIDRQKTRDLYPSQVDIADEIAKELRSAKPPFVGVGGKPLTGAYIKRHMLNGISSAQNRKRSTTPRRGK